MIKFIFAECDNFVSVLVLVLVLCLNQFTCLFIADKYAAPQISAQDSGERTLNGESRLNSIRENYNLFQVDHLHKIAIVLSCHYPYAKLMNV